MICEECQGRNGTHLEGCFVGFCKHLAISLEEGRGLLRRAEMVMFRTNWTPLKPEEALVEANRISKAKDRC